MIKKTINQVIDMISVVLILCAVIMLGALILRKEGEVPNIAGYSLLRVMTGSMEPTIRVDELLVVKETDVKSIQEGDIISFYSRSEELYGQINTHRVVHKIEENEAISFQTKGDANELVDKVNVQEGDLVGKVIGASYLAGRVVHLISNPIMFIILIAIPLLLMFIVNLIHVIQTTRQLAEEELEYEQALKLLHHSLENIEKKVEDEKQ